MVCSYEGVCFDSLWHSYLMFLATRRTGVEGGLAAWRIGMRTTEA
jgi:hypothetical protein